MSINLSSYQSIECGLFVRIQVDYYRATPTATPSSQILKFSDYKSPVTINGETYLPLGTLASITSTSSELRVSGGQVTIAVSGIPNSSIAEIVNSRIKGSPVKIYRVFFNPATGQQLNIAGNPVGRFFGIVNNYSLQEEYNTDDRSSTNTIVMTCSSYVDVLGNKVSGRRTNPQDQKYLYPTDLSMDRVPNLAGANFNFGASK